MTTLRLVRCDDCGAEDHDQHAWVATQYEGITGMLPSGWEFSRLDENTHRHRCPTCVLTNRNL